MEKRKLIPLSLMLLCSLCLTTACGKPSDNVTNVIATVDGKKITAENIYNTSLYDESTAEYVYGVLEKALIQSSIKVSNSMKTKVDNEVEKWRREIEENAALNSTNYEEDLQAALEEEGVSSIEELKQNKIYALQYEYAKQKFLEAKSEEYSNAYINSNYLYHIGDIAISISSSSTNTDLYNLTISASEAKNIYDAFSELVSGENYYTVAERYSGSETAKDGGEVGIVTLNDSDISNELRYALVGYSSIIEGKYDEFDFPTNDYTKALKDLYTGGIQSIPYSYIKTLDDVYSTKDGVDTKFMDANNSFYYSSGGNSVSSSSKVYYRNILFNNLLNTKTPKFITVTEEDVLAGANAVKMSNVLMPNEDSAGYSNEQTEQYVLTNELGNPYVVFKDSKGLHILTINKTPFESNIHEYYSSNPDSGDTIIAYAEFGKNMDARLEEVKSFAEKYITREYGANTGEDKLLSFAMFKYYLEYPQNGNFKIAENIKVMIDQYINSVNALADTKAGSDYKGYYETYSNLVWFRNQDYIVKEVPLLSCLTKESDGNYGCIYKYGEGFKKHTPSTGSEG